MAEETAIAASPVEASAASAPAEVETTATETDAPEEVATDTPADEESAATEQTEPESSEESPEDLPKETELAEFTGSAGARLRELCKVAPGLDKLLAQYPKAKDQIALSFRRDAALRDLNATVAEIREYRERLPNGLQDLQTIEEEVQQLGAIDSAYYGKQPGTLINHMWQADNEAAKALFRELPLQWSKLDPESYNETFKAILDSTFKRDRKADVALRAYNRAKQKGDVDAQNDMADLFNYLQSFGKEDVEETPRERALREKEERFNSSAKSQRDSQTKTFHDSFMSESAKFQAETIQSNPLFKKLPQAITEAKKARMVELVRNHVISHLEKSPAFRRQIEPAYGSMNLAKALEVQKGPQGWQPWLVNMYVRRVLAEELPGIVEGNNAANAKKKSAAAKTAISNRAPSRTPSPGSKTDKRTHPNDFSMQEIMSPGFEERHPGVMDAWLKNRGRN